MLNPITSLSFALLTLTTVACSPKDSEATDAASSSTAAVATTGGTSSSTDATVTTEVTSSTTGDSTSTTTLDPEDPENCMEFCGPIKYECGDPSNGTDSGDPECAAGTHCERTTEKIGACACAVWVCKEDCDPNDPRDCSELYQKCDAENGMCYYDECRSKDDCCDFDSSSGGDCGLECQNGLCEHGV